MLIAKTENLGNTFSGLICAAFKCRQEDVRIFAELQHGNCGTIKVRDVWSDWFDRGDSIEFIEAY